MNKLTTLASALAIVAAGYSGAASSALSVYLGEPNQFDDESAEEWIDRDDAGTPGAGVLSIGDTLRGVLQLDFIEGNFSGNRTDFGGPLDDSELTALYEVQVTGVFDNDGNPVDPSTVAEANYTFGVYNPFVAEVAALTGEAAADLGGLMVAFWEEATGAGIPFDLSGVGLTRSDAEDSATGGEFVLGLGIAAADDFWAATEAATNPDIAIGLPQNQGIGIFDFGLSAIFNNTNASDFGATPKINPLTGALVGVDFAGNGDVFSSGFGLGQTPGPYYIWNNVQGTFNPIPEPAALALMGMGLLGFGATRLRRKA